MVERQGEPRVLAIETSHRRGQVAVAAGSTLLGLRRLDESRRHARDLAPAVCDLLAEQGWRPRDIEVVLVSRGPGSYTGLRVGLISARTLAYATGCLLFGISTAEIIAAQASAWEGRLDVLIDAQQDRVYMQSFEQTPAGFRAVSEIAIRPFSAWAGQSSLPGWVSGPGLHGREGRLPPGVQVIDPTLWEPQAAVLLRQGMQRWREGAKPDDVWSLEPLYLRPSAAEQQWKEKK